jgi:hypothetical protein
VDGNAANVNCGWVGGAVTPAPRSVPGVWSIFGV